MASKRWAKVRKPCAAAELGLAAGERYGGIHGVGELIRQLAETQAITRHTTSGTWVTKERGPHRRASLRTYEPAVTVVAPCHPLAAKPDLYRKLQKQTLNQRLRRRIVEGVPYGMALEGLTAADLAYQQQG